MHYTARMLALVLAAVVATQASASPPPDDDAAARARALAERHSPEPGEIHTDNGISARVLAGTAELDHDGEIFGFGVAYERDLFHGLVAVELAAEVMVSGGDQIVLLELALEKPVALSDHVTFYFGGGPTVLAHAFENGHTQPGWGGLVLWGIEYDLGAGFEVFAEVDTALFWVHAPVLEADVGTGVMYRF